MGRRNVDDLLAAGAVLLAAAAGWFGLREVPFQPMAAGLGPAFFPATALMVLAILGLLLLIQALVRKHADHGSAEHHQQPAWYSLCGMGVLVAYAILFLYVGCLIATQMVLLVSMLLLGVPWRRAFVHATGATALIYIVFGFALGVRF